MEYTGSQTGRANLPEQKKGNGFTIFVAVVTAIVVFLGGMFAYSMYQEGQNKIHFKEVTLVEAGEEASKSENAIVIAGSKTCVHCQTYKPVARDFAKEQNTKIYYVDLAEGTNKEDMEKYPDLMTKGTPTTYYFHKGKKVHSSEGERSAVELQQDVNTAKVQGFEFPKI